MNEIAILDKNLSIERTPQLIAIEINSIKEQTRKMVLFNSIEIGRRLVEAKLIIKHGEWGEWLSKSVDYSQRTASNLMAIFEQYGSSQITLFCDNAKSQALANLSYTQAVALLGIPQEEREAFIQENDIDSMSTRELQQAIKDNQELEAKLKEIEAGWISSRKAVDDAKQLAVKKTEEAQDLAVDIQRLKMKLDETKLFGDKTETERIRLNKRLKETNSELFLVQEKLKELERQLKETPIEVTAAEIIEKVPEEVERELNNLRQRNKELEAKGAQPISTTTIRFKLHFDSLVKGFSDLLGVLDEIDTDVRDKYKNAVAGLLSKMTERL